MNNNNIGEKLKDYFAKQNLSQKQVADMLGISQQAVGSLLNGKPFGKKTASKWFDRFGFNPNWLITGEGDMFYTNEQLVFNHTTEEMFRKISTEAFSDTLQKLIDTGVLYPAKVIEQKEAEIQRLNNEIDKMRSLIENLSETIKILSTK